MDDNFYSVWVYLSESPLLGLTMTLVAYGIGYRLYHRFNANPLLNPVVIAVGLLILCLWILDMPYKDYFDGAQFVHFLLGPATVALAVPLYSQFTKLRKWFIPILITLISGVFINVFTAIFIGWALGAKSETLLSLAPKSVTAPVAMGIAEKIGGLPSLTAVLVVTTGVIGAIVGTRIFSWMKISDNSIQGIAMGISAHGIGTARAFQVSPEMGAFSGLAMALSALTTSIILPLTIHWYSVFIYG